MISLRLVVLPRKLDQVLECAPRLVHLLTSRRDAQLIGIIFSLVDLVLVPAWNHNDGDTFFLLGRASLAVLGDLLLTLEWSCPSHRLGVLPVHLKKFFIIIFA